MFKSPRKMYAFAGVLIAAAIVLAGCSSSREVKILNPADSAPSVARAAENSAPAQPAPQQPPAQPAVKPAAQPAAVAASVQYALKTDFGANGMVFIGVGGEIDGIINPDLVAAAGETVEILLINGDGMLHDIAFPELDAFSEGITAKGTETTLVFTAGEEGIYTYFCTIPGHRQAGMEGQIIVGDAAPAETVSGPSIVLNPADLPAPLEVRGPQTHTLEIETTEIEGHLADGTTFTYWTFGNTIPGPFLRVRVGDTVELTLTNAPDSSVTHSIDLHAVTGPGGGAAVTQVPPGESKTFTFKALNPGLYVYHCATPMVAHHIANGMYGLILVEPEEGLPAVDREFYVMQGEIYTLGALGEKGRQEISIEKLLAENPEYFVFNGAVGALTDLYPLQANVGETVRIYFGVGGPNFVSSFHVIGEIFDRVYDQGALTSAPLTDIQTTLVPPGGAAMVEFTVDYPGRYILVDHALSRAERGLVGFLIVEGEADPEIFHSEEEQSGEGH
jgi:nitrite reductase (NO-forming)